MSFFTVLKQNALFSYVIPTLESFSRSFGYSEYIHSSLEELLNKVLVASAYLGLMNSMMSPLVFLRVASYSGRLKTIELMLPGNRE